MLNTTKIAIADDHALFRKGLAALINLFANYQVVLEAGNGQEMVNNLDAANLPDIVLMDINMPVMDGYEAAEWLNNNHPNIKILALSTMDADTAIIKMIKCGARGYVLKDAEPAELKLAFDEVLSLGYFYNEVVTRKVMRTIHELTVPGSSVHTFANLSDREVEFLKYTCTELSYKEIADKMFLSARTVEGYRDALCEKLNLKTRVGLAMFAVKNNIAQL